MRHLGCNYFLYTFPTALLIYVSNMCVLERSGECAVGFEAFVGGSEAGKTTLSIIISPNCNSFNIECPFATNYNSYWFIITGTIYLISFNLISFNLISSLHTVASSAGSHGLWRPRGHGYGRGHRVKGVRVLWWSGTQSCQLPEAAEWQGSHVWTAQRDAANWWRWLVK